MVIQPQASVELFRARHLSLTTFRKSGEGVPTPVWFAEHQGTLYVRIHPSRGKIKRIQHTARVTLAPCTSNGTVTGTTFAGKARLVSEPEEMELAETELTRKYGLLRRLYFPLMSVLRRIRRQPEVVGRAYLAINLV